MNELTITTLRRLQELGNIDRSIIEGLARDWEEVGEIFQDPGGLTTGLVHGDLCCNNILIKDGRVVGFIDFGDAQIGLQVCDFAYLVMEISMSADNSSIEWSLLRSLLRAYARVRSLKKPDRCRLYDALRFQCFKFLGYSLHYTIVDGKHALENEYFQRLVFLRDPRSRQQIKAVIEEEL